MQRRRLTGIETTPPPLLRRGPARNADLLAATLLELRTSGYDRMTVDAVAARARASKATIYRRWPSKAELVVAAFAAAVAEPPAALDTGSLRGDLLALLDALVDELGEFSDVIATLVGALRRDPDLAEAMHRGYIDARRQLMRGVFERARMRGELADDADLDIVWQLAPATLFFRVLLSGESIDAGVARELVDKVVLPLLTP